jgi:hypothetical protein
LLKFYDNNLKYPVSIPEVFVQCQDEEIMHAGFAMSLGGIFRGKDLKTAEAPMKVDHVSFWKTLREESYCGI